jgi:hypothetical protein
LPYRCWAACLVCLCPYVAYWSHGLSIFDILTNYQFQYM